MAGRQLHRALADGELAQPQPVRDPGQPRRLEPHLGHRRGDPLGADHGDPGHRVLRVRGTRPIAVLLSKDGRIGSPGRPPRRAGSVVPAAESSAGSNS